MSAVRLGAGLVLGLLVCAALAPWIARVDPESCLLASELAAPSRLHWLGADADGCDIYSRIVFGSRISLFVGVSVVSVSALVGTAVGLPSGWYGGRIDQGLMFVLECFQAFPGILMAIAITALAPTRSIGLVVVALCVSGWVSYARLVRAKTLELREAEFITAARAVGMPPARIMVREILPNVAPLLMVQATFGMAGAILAEAGLSFLGLGAPPGVPSWGSMLNEGRQYMLVAPHLSVFPGAAIMLTVLGFNFLGDGLRDRTDPRTRTRARTGRTYSAESSSSAAESSSSAAESSSSAAESSSSPAESSSSPAESSSSPAESSSSPAESSSSPAESSSSPSGVGSSGTKSPGV